MAGQLWQLEVPDFLLLTFDHLIGHIARAGLVLLTYAHDINLRHIIKQARHRDPVQVPLHSLHRLVNYRHQLHQQRVIIENRRQQQKEWERANITSHNRKGLNILNNTCTVRPARETHSGPPSKFLQGSTLRMCVMRREGYGTYIYIPLTDMPAAGCFYISTSFYFQVNRPRMCRIWTDIKA